MNCYSYKCSKLNEFKTNEKTFEPRNDQNRSFCLNFDGVCNYFDKNSLDDEIKQTLPDFLFFKPYYFFDESQHKWTLLESGCSGLIDINPLHLIKKKVIVKQKNNLQLDFSVFFEQSISHLNTFNLEIQKVDKNSFLENFESFKSSNNYCFIGEKIEKEQNNFFIQGSKLIQEDSFNFSGNIFFNFMLKGKETLSFIMKKNDKDKIIKKKYFIKIPNYNGDAEFYDVDKEYKIGDLVFCDKITYKCKKSGKGKLDSPEFWQKFETFENSFFTSDQGKLSLGFLKKQLSFLIEKQIGDEVILDLMDDNITVQINNSFIFDGKNYRVVEFVKKNIEGRFYVQIKGIEILKNKIELPLFDDFKIDLSPFFVEVSNFNNKSVLVVNYLDKICLDHEKIVNIEGK